MTTRITDLQVEQLALGELADAEAFRARLLSDNDPRLETIEHSNAEILRDYPPAAMAAQIRRRLEREPTEVAVNPWAIRLPIALLATAAAVAAVVWLAPSRALTPMERALESDVIAQLDRPVPEEILTKGSPMVVIHRREGSKTERLLDGARVASGDLLQVSYRASGASHGVIVSVDGAGAVTLHFPPAGGSTALRSDGLIALDHAYRLDDAPGFERFFLITSTSEIDVAAVENAAERLTKSQEPRNAALPVGPGVRQISVLLDKSKR